MQETNLENLDCAVLYSRHAQLVCGPNQLPAYLSEQLGCTFGRRWAGPAERTGRLPPSLTCASPSHTATLGRIFTLPGLRVAPSPWAAGAPAWSAPCAAWATSSRAPLEQSERLYII